MGLKWCSAEWQNLICQVPSVYTPAKRLSLNVSQPILGLWVTTTWAVGLGILLVAPWSGGLWWHWWLYLSVWKDHTIHIDETKTHICHDWQPSSQTTWGFHASEIQRRMTPDLGPRGPWRLSGKTAMESENEKQGAECYQLGMSKVLKDNTR